MYNCPFYENPNYNWGYPEYHPFFREPYPANMCITKSQLDLMNQFRVLWEQHSIWTRLGIMSIVSGSPDTDLVVNRLLRNPVDFARALMPYYGQATAAKFGNLLRDHLVIASELVKAAKAGDNKTAADAEKRWYANADQIALLLSQINPNWSQEEWRKMLHTHLALVKAEAVDLLNKNYAAGIAVYDEIEKQALEMADVMSRGIIKQFPNAFMR